MKKIDAEILRAQALKTIRVYDATRLIDITGDMYKRMVADRKQWVEWLKEAERVIERETVREFVEYVEGLQFNGLDEVTQLNWTIKINGRQLVVNNYASLYCNMISTLRETFDLD